MALFSFSPADYVDEFNKNGYVHIKNGVNLENLAYIQAKTKELTADQNDLKEWEFKGKKQQYLFDFPAEWNFPEAIFQPLASVASMPYETFTMCERHIKVYDKSAKPSVPPHKDRVAAELTVGIPLFMPEGSESHLVLWPNDALDVNPLNTTALWRSSLDEQDLPENRLADIEPVRVYTEPGDVIMFRGSSIYHEREYPADTALLYLKFNAMRLDPLNEDPSTSLQEDLSLKNLSEKTDNELLDCAVEVSPKLYRISRHYTRLHWKEVIQAYVTDEKEFNVSELELRIFKEAENKRSVREIIARLGIPGPEAINYVPTFRRLGALKGLHFI
ncbi:MAG: hypothetical protein MJA28_12115 [Gammaproteobacteria bacterium]|nr:hypothetical protein [Gammaproteobacteria bacterium]